MNARVADALVGRRHQRSRPIQSGIESGEAGDAETDSPALQVMACDLRGQGIDETDDTCVVEEIHVRLARVDSKRTVEMRGTQFHRPLDADVAEILGLEIAAHAVDAADGELLVVDERLRGVLPGHSKRNLSTP